jgi:hypothetical protein
MSPPAVALMGKFLSLNNANIVCDGNSLTAILGLPGPGIDSWYGDIDNPYPVQLAEQLKLSYSGFTIRNFGVGGQNSGSMAADAPTQIDPLISATRPNILIMWEITNEISNSGTTVNTAYSRTVAYCNARRAAGWKVIVVTAIRREGSLGGQTIANLNSRLQSVNALVRANWRDFANALYDVALMPEFSSISDTYFLPDKIHLNAFGQKLFTAGLIPILKRIPR